MKLLILQVGHRRALMEIFSPAIKTSLISIVKVWSRLHFSKPERLSAYCQVYETDLVILF